MKPSFAIPTIAALACTSLASALTIEQIGRYGLPDVLVLDDGDLVGSNPAYDKAAAEIASFDKDTAQLFVTNSFLQGIDVIDLSDPTSPNKVGFIDITGEGDEPTSCVVIPGGYIAVAVKADPAQDPGTAAFYKISDGSLAAAVTTGALPDNIVLSPDGSKVITANEGEPDDDYIVDPEGSLTVIDISVSGGGLTIDGSTEIGFARFDNKLENLTALGVRIFGPGASVSQDLEPEYVAVSADSKTAYVCLQENNAIAVVDLVHNRVDKIWPLGYKKHWKKGNGFDASNRDDAVDIRPRPTLGMLLPDAITTYEYKGKTLLFTANEGDSRDYDGFSEEIRAKDLDDDDEPYLLGPGLANSNPGLLEDEDLGRLKITTAAPSGTRVDKKSGDLIFDKLYSYGARSFSIFEADKGRLIYDSGDDFEQITSGLDVFNSTNDETEADGRSDDKGPEPEAVAIGNVDGTDYAFIAFERTGGVVAYDLTDPTNPVIAGYANGRLAPGVPGAGVSTLDDLAPEDIVFIPGADNATGLPIIAVPHEVSGSVVIYKLVP